jgi:hypothetical protein
MEVKLMIQHIWSILCERISTDHDTNLVSYLTCIEEITVNQLPFAIPLLALGSLWQTDRPSKDVLKERLILVSPEGSEKTLIEPEDCIFEKERHRINIILNGIPFDKFGKYIFKVQIKAKEEWKTVAEIPLKVGMQTNADKSKVIHRTN